MPTPAGFVHTSGSLVLHQDPAEGATVYMGVTNFVSAATGYVGGCFVQKAHLMPTTRFSKIQWGDGLTVTPDDPTTRP